MGGWLFWGLIFIFNFVPLFCFIFRFLFFWWGGSVYYLKK